MSTGSKGLLGLVCILISGFLLYTACDSRGNSKDGEVLTEDLAQKTTPSFPAITIQSNVPEDIPGGASNATLAEAAAFAWQEFIALSWPAVEQTGDLNTRDTPDNNKAFGSPGSPIVWETYRHKVEVFPGPGNQPNGYTSNAAQDYGYDAAPQYNYLFPINPCDGPAPPSSAFINLDEISQIGLNDMSAGVNASLVSNNNSDPTLIRFLAKANRTQYKYIAKKNYWDFGGDYYTALTNFTNAINAGRNKIPTDSIVNFPTGTIETKAAWRQLSAAEAASGKFYKTQTRYYEGLPGATEGNPKPCYVQNSDEVWGLIALHIMHKTPSAPYFTFATFEQADNILTKDGKPVEDENGNIINTPSNSGPTTPAVTYIDPLGPNGNDSLAGVHLASGSNYINPDDIGSELYYQNTVNGLPSEGLIAVNQRINKIPSDIIAVNEAAHTAIASYNAANNILSSPWSNYKLVNIQYRPFNESDITAGENDVNNASTYYQANIVVETNNTLQKFTGQQIKVQPGIIHEKSVEYQGVKSEYGFTTTDSTFSNVHVPGANGYYENFTMGGCMGCHGNAQVAGADFSFILFFGPNRFPEYPETNLKTRNVFKRRYGGGKTSNVQVY